MTTATKTTIQRRQIKYTKSKIRIKRERDDQDKNKKEKSRRVPWESQPQGIKANEIQSETPKRNRKKYEKNDEKKLNRSENMIWNE